MVGLERVTDGAESEELRQLIQRYAGYTRSQRAFRILALWEQYIPRFIKVIPKDYARVLKSLARVRESGLSGEDAIMAAFEENARDLARVGGG
jgi:glutamate synthase (ferredoxin)